MLLLAKQPRAIFLGQNVAYDGTVMYHDFEGIPEDRRIEMPVAEELQLGIAIGLSLKGYLPICVYPRIDFMLRALDQLVNHLDKLEQMSRGQFRPKVIIHTRVASREPLDAGPQHTQDHTNAFRQMLHTVEVVQVWEEAEVLPAYREAIKRERSTLVIESLDVARIQWCAGHS